MKYITTMLFCLFIINSCAPGESDNTTSDELTSNELSIKYNEENATISVYRGDGEKAVLTQNAEADHRPFIHPIMAPDGQGVLTEVSPGHHTHQTGLYWGFTSVNGRDYFHNPGGEYWKRVSVDITELNEGHNHEHDHGQQDGDNGHNHGQSDDGAQEPKVAWQTVYDLLDEDGTAILRETQNWSMQESDGEYILNLEWSGEAKTDITIGEFDYGGLFLRMPWQDGINGEVVNSVRSRNERAEGEKAQWIDVGMQVKGRDDLARITILDHPENRNYPNAWRVDDQMGVGPSMTRDGDWTIEVGKTEVIRHQLIAYTEEFSDIETEAAFANYTDNTPGWSTIPMWHQAQAEGLEADFLTPDEAAEHSTVMDGFKVNAWAGEPMFSTPMAFAWDDQGRLWVAENNDYSSRGDGFSASGDSRIVILEDTDGDGYADKQKVFLEGIAFPAALAIGFDGLFLGAPPNLLFVPFGEDDKDVADMDNIEVRLTGWGIDDRHETLNSLHWGPDGWLYGLQGFFTYSTVGKPKPGAERIYTHNDPFPESLEDLVDGEGTEIDGGVWRYHPTKDRFEIVSHGLSNPWGIDHNAKGQLFTTACVIPHLWHTIPGGVYHRQGGSHFNPHIYDDIKTIADHRHRSAHGGASIYLSDAFPEEHYGRIFMANIHEHAVLSDVMEREGSGFTAHHGDEMLHANNAAWVGFSTEIGPDGSLYILDWHDRDICGNQVLHEDTGRIFKISPEESQADEWEGRYDDVSKMTDSELIDLQTRNSAWHARRARVNLQYRATKGELDEDTHDKLHNMFLTHSNADWRLRAMWALHVTEGFTENNLIEALDDEDEYIRAWAIQLLSEDYSVTSEPRAEATPTSNWALRHPSEVQTPADGILEKFQQMAREDSSPIVRLYLASSLQRLDHNLRWDIAGELMLRGDDDGDHNIPKMIWFGFEPLVGEDPDRAIALASQSEIPLIARYTSRRAVSADAFEPLITAIGNQPKRQISLLEGMRDGLESRGTELSAPSNWASVYERLQNSTDRAAQLALEVAQQFGDETASLHYLTTLQDKSAPQADRREALMILADEKHQDLPGELAGLIDESDFRIDAIQAVAAFDDEYLGNLLMDRYPQFTSAEKQEVVRTMASRPNYGHMLTEAMKEEAIPRRDIPVDIARQLQRVVGVGFVDVWGPIGEELNTEEMEGYVKYRDLLTESAIQNADEHQGRVVFDRTCGSCHTMYDTGGEVGPDLTGSNRSDLDYLLRKIMNPSEDIMEAYKLVVITTREGRTYSGNVISESERQVTLRIVGNEVVINKSDIQSREETTQSMMPARLFDALTDSEVLDLVSYLRTTEQVNLP